MTFGIDIYAKKKELVQLQNSLTYAILTANILEPA